MMTHHRSNRRTALLPTRVVASMTLCAGIGLGAAAAPEAAPSPAESAAERDARMTWWREARFGLFIHWGLYAIPAGEWNGRDTYGEWIRHSAQIPIDVYDHFRPQFNPTGFDPDAWFELASAAGMRYVVITSKHHDGFCLFDSAQTDFDIMSTPWRRDIMTAIAEAARRHDMVPCWYHSIMDWHHPDYLPRRAWERADRPEGDADFDRFERYLHAQVTELLTNYGPIGVMWFDGEWENTWTPERGKRLDALCRALQPSIIVNNRVDKGRNDMAGLNRAGEWAGDFGTPEQQVPPEGLPGVDWEACITMNSHWGWNAADRNWKSSTELVRMLCDIVSKGGNLLLNVGPRADGTFPPEAVERLRDMAAWMAVNGESIHGTTASRLGLPDWGRSTTRVGAEGASIYLQVFDAPAEGTLDLPGLWDVPAQVRVLGQLDAKATASRIDGGVRVALDGVAPDPHCTVIELAFAAEPTIYAPPSIEPSEPLFLGALAVEIAPARPLGPGETLRYTLDGSAPTAGSPATDGVIALARDTAVSAQVFRDGRPASPVAQRTYRLAVPRAGGTLPADAVPGLAYEIGPARLRTLAEAGALEPERRAIVGSIAIPAEDAKREYVHLRYAGWLQVPADAVYDFVLTSDDGSRLWIGEELIVDNDGLHASQERSGRAALGAGWHPIRIDLFNATGGFDLDLKMGRSGEEPRSIPSERLLAPPLRP